MVVLNWLNCALNFHIKYFPAKNMKATTWFGTGFFFPSGCMTIANAAYRWQAASTDYCYHYIYYHS